MGRHESRLNSGIQGYMEKLFMVKGIDL